MFQGEVESLTGGDEQQATSPRAARLNRSESYTDGHSPDERNKDTYCSFADSLCQRQRP